MSFARGLKARASKTWEEGYHHPFVQELGKGTLDRGKFQFYLLQDYQYLLQYAKVHALAVIKAEDESTMARLTAIQHSILNGEMNLHREYMAGFGVSHEQMLRVKPSLYNRAYTANMLAAGELGGLVDVLVSVFPCAWTYHDYARRLKEQYSDRLEGNFYRTWIENYASSEFAGSCEWFYDAIDQLVEHQGAARREQLVELFIASVEFEYLFWDMSYRQAMSY